jgi:hypothetical protein
VVRCFPLVRPAFGMIHRRVSRDVTSMTSVRDR